MMSCVVGDLRFGLITLDLEKDDDIYEQWLWNGVCAEEGKKKSPPPSHREKTLTHQKPPDQLTLSF